MRLHLVVLVGCVAVLGLAQGGLGSIVVDGQLGDWGVTPFADWQPDWPAWYTEENWGDHPGESGAYPNGGEVFDQEALYARIDNDVLYMAIVTSMPEAGYYARGRQIMPGDLAMDFDGDGVYEFGIVGYGSDKGQVYFEPAWSLPDGDVGFPSQGPSTLSGGTYLDTIPFLYADAGVLEADATHTYILEMSIPMALLGNPDGTIRLHHVMTCGNDALDGEIEVQNVPEPATVGVMMLGTVLTVASRRRGR